MTEYGKLEEEECCKGMQLLWSGHGREQQQHINLLQ